MQLKQQARPADLSVSMPSFLQCVVLFLVTICFISFVPKICACYLPNVSGSPVIVTESSIEFVVVYAVRINSASCV